MNLEIAAAQTLIIVGPVWSNGGMWSGSTTVTFQNTVSAVGFATNCANDPFCNPVYTGSGKSTYSKAGQPTGGNDRITMPIGTNNDPDTIEALVNLPPAPYTIGTAGAFTTNGQQYLANEADLYLTNFPNGTNWVSRHTHRHQHDSVLSGCGQRPSYQTQFPYDFYLITNRNTHTIFSTNLVSSALPPTSIMSPTSLCRLFVCDECLLLRLA